MNINDLPPELLAMIFSKIDGFYDKVRLEVVCRHWRQTVLDWERTKICPVPLIDHHTLGFVLYRWGEWLEELWIKYMMNITENQIINEYMVNQMANRMKQLKHLKLSKCQLDGPAVNSIADLFGQQLCSFILDETDYHPNMRGMLENESSKLEHLKIDKPLWCYYSAGTLPTKLPNNLKSFSLFDQLDGDSSIPILNAAKDCKNLKLLHFEINMFGTLTPNAILAIGNIQSLVYLNLDVNTIQDETTLQNVICGLPNLKALRIAGHCSKETQSNICRGRPDLVHLNVSTRNAFQIPDSLNSLTLRIPSAVNASQFLRELLFEQPNKSIQHLDIRSLVLHSSTNFMEKLLGQFPNLKSLHCKMPASDAELTSFFSLIQKHLAIGRKITIYVHFYDQHNDPAHYKYILPDDLTLINKAGWKPEISKRKCENLVLKKLIKEAIEGGNNPSFLDIWWKE